MPPEHSTSKPRVWSRPASTGDIAFFSKLYGESRATEVAAFGWNEEQQLAFLNMQFTARQIAYKLQYPDAEDRVILIETEVAGRLIIDRSKDPNVIVEVAVAHKYQRKGLASRVIKDLQEEATDANNGLLLRVDKHNVPAMELYRKVGFEISDENQIMYSMTWRANPNVKTSDNTEASVDGEVKMIPVSEEDREFLMRVYAEARRDELARTMWSVEQTRMFVEHQLNAQTRHYHAVYPNSTHEIILWNNEPAGRLFVDRGAKEIAILDITVLTAFRRRGIATTLITRLKNEATAQGMPVRIYVETFNPSTAFFEKLAFRAVEQDGVNVKYVWIPEKSIRKAV